MWEESHRLHRTVPLAWALRLIGLFASREKKEEWRKFSAVVMLERAPSSHGV